MAMFARILTTGLLAVTARRSLATMNRKAVVVDTDVGLDDLFALCTLLGRKDEIDVRLITTVGGMTTPEFGASTVRRLLAAFGRNDDIPVVAGNTGRYTIGDASEWGRNFAATYPEKLERLNLPPDPGSDGNGDGNDAARRLAEALSAKSPPSLLCLGPLTNVAAALPLTTTIPGNDVDAVIMGGAVRCAGNSGTDGRAEFNIYADAPAARVVTTHDSLRSIVLADLSTANEDRCGEVSDFVNGLEDDDDDDDDESVVRRLLRSLIAIDPSCSGYDTVATASFLSDDVLETEEVRLNVDPDTGVTTEAAAVDGNAAVVRLGTKVNSPALLRVLEKSVDGGAGSYALARTKM